MAQECVMGGQLQWDWTHLCRWNSFQTFVAAPSFQFLENPFWIRGKRNLVEEADCSAFTLLSVTDRILGRQGLELSCKDLGCVISRACNHLTIWAGNWIQLRCRKKWVKISQIHGFWANVWLAQFYLRRRGYMSSISPLSPALSLQKHRKPNKTNSVIAHWV